MDEDVKTDVKPEGDIAQETGKDTPPPELWARELEDAKKAFDPYWKKCDRIVQRYKGGGFSDNDGDNTKSKRRYNVLWSVIKTMQPLVYSVPPKPFVSRRFNDADPVARDASLILERAQKFSLEGNELHDALTDARDDYLLTSRGVIWAKYTPYMRLRRVDVQEGMKLPPTLEIKFDEQTGQQYYEYEEKIYEECDWEHVHYRDFMHGPAGKWRHVPWVARKVPMTRRELIKRFGKKVGKLPPLTINQQSRSGGTSSDGDQINDEDRGLFAKAEVWEIWDKRERMVYWLCPKLPKVFLDEQPDILELDGFFPCCKPVYSTKTSESLIPVPDFMLWQDIAIELDDVTHRIKLLVEALRVVGVYDASIGDTIKRVVTQTIDNDLIPVQGWAMFAERGGLANSIEFLPIEQVAATLERLHMHRQRLVQELYEITGISDVVRGASDPRETASAQKVKSQFANKRLSIQQKEMERMIDEALGIQSEIMAKHYSPETLKMVSSAREALTDVNGVYDERRFQDAIKLIQSSMRQFRISVDEKSLVEQSKAEDQEQRGMIIGSLSQLLAQAPAFLEQVGPAGGPLMARLMMFAVRAYPLARSEEDSIQQAVTQLLNAPPPQQEEQPQQGKSPEELQLEQQKIDISKQEFSLKREQSMFEREYKMQELDLKRREMDMAFSNRNNETMLRKEKQEADTMLRDKQIEAQVVQSEEKNTVDLVKWMGDKKEQQREADMQDEREYEKIAQQYAAAFAKQDESKKAA